MMSSNSVFSTQENQTIENEVLEEFKNKSEEVSLLHRYSLPVFALILLSLVVILGYQNIVLRQQVVQNSSSDTPLTENAPLRVANELLPSTTLSVEEAEWLAYSNSGISMPNDFWKGFTVYYPIDWSIELSENPQNTNFSVSLHSKNNDVLVIGQREMGIGTCIYPNDPRFDSDEIGMYSRMINFVEINHSSGEIWRLSEPLEKMGDIDYIVCAPNVILGEYADATPFGLIYVSVTDPKSLDLVNEIIQKTKIE